MKQEIIDHINSLARQEEPFLFAINYHGTEAYVKRLAQISPEECLYDFEGITNAATSEDTPDHPPLKWNVAPPALEDYRESFDTVRRNILAGNSYLTNLTCQVQVECNLSLKEIFQRAKGKYKLWLNAPAFHHAHFVCFSPETFVRIRGGRIFSYPMKGTLDASVERAEQVLMGDEKEAAEHATIVDLIRNDLSRVATEVRVERYRYAERLHTNKGDILQTSSEISGLLPADYRQHLGDLLATQLPAGSITGAPKEKTLQIIRQAETYERGFYTGIMGICDKGELDSAVMIRFLEQDDAATYFKAGGGITSKSHCRREYEEVVQKIYLPFE